MIREVTDKNDAILVEQFIGNDFYNCPYFYLNLKKYGLKKGRIRLFVDVEKNDIQVAALLYYDCLHLYYKDGIEIGKTIFDLLYKLDPRTVFMPSFDDGKEVEIIGYKGKEVLVMGPKQYLDINTSQVKNAELSDIPRISRFMYSFWPDIYDSEDTICKQIQERMLDNYGRTKYIEDEGNIVACVSSFAELSDFAVCGGLLVADSQRGKKLGSVMLRSIYEELESEGKKPCGIIVEDYSRIFHEKNGFVILGKLNKYNKIL